MNKKVTQEKFDLIIIGGGINGCAVARDASLRGLKTLLLEKEDFACGASSKSSKLAHGGLRYLKNYEFRLVYESLRERNLLLKHSPNLVRPLPFLYPAYKQTTEPLWKIRLGLSLYDLLSAFGSLPRHQTLGKDKVLEAFPTLKQEGLKGGGLYFDAQMEDHRLVIENMLAAESLGSQCLNYTPVNGFIYEGEQIVGVKAGDVSYYAKGIVNTTGPWANELLKLVKGDRQNLVRPTKGIHIVIDALNTKTALLLQAPQDGRVFFLIPWKGHTLVGTTESAFSGDPSDLTVNKEEVNYLIEAVNHYFPKLELTGYKVRASFAGLRPLTDLGASNLNKASREELFDQTAPGLLSLVGGKYTTYRAMAEELVDLAVKTFSLKDNGKRTSEIPLYERAIQEAVLFSEEEKENIALRYGEHAPLVTHLIGKYGKGYHTILDRVIENPIEGQSLCDCHPHVLAEVAYAIENEKAKTLSDWFFRRTSMGYTGCRGLKASAVVADKFASHFGWDRARRDQEIKAYGQLIREEMAVYGGSPQRL